MWAPRSASGPTPSSAPRPSSPPASTSSSSTPPTATRARGGRHGAPAPAPHRATSSLIAGNIVTAEAAEALIDAGADALKVGMGARGHLHHASRRGVGVPQITAIHDVSRVAAREGVPVIGDGGLTSSGDIAKAIAAGAGAVMLGSMLAGTDEAPGEVVVHQGERFKEYRGMGSLGAMKAGGFSKDRYFQGDVEDSEKLVPQGIEGRVSYKGPLTPIVHQMMGGLRQAMAYCGAADGRPAQDRALRPHHLRRPPREPPARRDDHEGSAELSPLRWSSCRSRPRRSAPFSSSTAAASTRSSSRGGSASAASTRSSSRTRSRPTRSAAQSGGPDPLRWPRLGVRRRCAAPRPCDLRSRGPRAGHLLRRAAHGARPGRPRRQDRALGSSARPT